MPLLTAAVTSVALQTTVLFAAILSAVVAPPGSQDIYASMGALLAGTCTLIESRTSVRTATDSIVRLLTTAAIGTIVPSIAFGYAKGKGWIDPAVEPFINWSWFAGAGLFCGMNAWAFVHFLPKWGARAMNWLDRKFGGVSSGGDSGAAQ